MKDKTIHILFKTSGGAGGILVQANFIKAFRVRFPFDYIRISVMGHTSREFNDSVFKGQEFIDDYFSPDLQSSNMNYDIIIRLNLFPEVLFEASDVQSIMPELHDLLEIWRRFIDKDEIRKKAVKRHEYNYQVYAYAKMLRKSWLNVQDISNQLGLNKRFILQLRIQKDIDSVLVRYGLEKGKYITMQRCATSSLNRLEVPKLWPLEYYNQLTIMLKKSYPDIKLVQLGESILRNKLIDGIDINLVGKTDWEDIKVLLKYALLHIDGECGMVHMREALQGGPSVVLFGPTMPEFYAYEDNINIRSDACPNACARLTDTWQQRCILGKKPPCMYSITPEHVMSRVNGYIQEGFTCFNPTMSEILLSDESIRLDSDWTKNHLPDWLPIHYYQIVPVRLNELIANFMDGEKSVHRPLLESPAYLYLHGQKEKYVKHIEMLKAHRNDDIHTIERFEKFCESLNLTGYDAMNKIVVNDKNLILDGQHRAAWLMYKYGESHFINVLKIWSYRKL